MNIGQKLIITVGAFVITFITTCTLFRGDIDFLLMTRSIDRKYGNEKLNTYFLEDNFNYVDNYEKTEIHNRDELINSIYYVINSGVAYTERYCSKNYSNCYNDIDAISQDSNLLSILNNFVHPYNSFSNISFEFNNRTIKIKITHSYSKDEIKKINEIVDKFIDENITNEMTTKEKIKVVHDYVINNADYDTEFDPKNDNNKYKANTAYGVLVDKFGICSGYSDAISIFLNKLNIINYKINNSEHIWNLVYLDEKWYHLDATWDDPISNKNITRDNYFLIDTNTLELLDDNEHFFNSTIFSELTQNKKS